MTTSELYDILHVQQDAQEEEEQYWQNRGNQFGFWAARERKIAFEELRWCITVYFYEDTDVFKNGAYTSLNVPQWLTTLILKNEKWNNKYSYVGCVEQGDLQTWGRMLRSAARLYALRRCAEIIEDGGIENE